MKRREFITLLGGVAVAWPIAARAQQPAKLPVIGMLFSGTPSSYTPWINAFSGRLRELGWIDNRTVSTEYRWAEGNDERLIGLAKELVARKVDVIVTSGTPATLAVKQATADLPIVFANTGDPIGSGLVASLARPGGNITGLSNQQNDSATKRLELLRELAPGRQRIAVIANLSNPPAVSEIDLVHATAKTIGVKIITLDVRRVEDITLALYDVGERADALYVYFEPLTHNHRHRINTFALAARLPTISASREFVSMGGLASYGANVTDLFRRSAEYVDKILRGAKPADLPVEQPIKFDLVINLITAKALRLAVPEAILLRADEVIE